MKVLFVHNSYSDSTPSGEEYASRELAALLAEHGHEVRWFKRSSDEIRSSFYGHVKAFFAGIYNPRSAKTLDKVLEEYHPDIVQVQNIYPLLSSSIFKTLKKRGIPVVMRCPNYRLFCPSGLCLSPKGDVCEKCFGGKEWNCVLNNCERNLFKSLGYSLRNVYSRLSRSIINGVDLFIVQSEFQKQIFIEQGIPCNKIIILPGISPEIENIDTSSIGDYVSFVGRVSVEKGIYEFIEAARNLPSIPFKVAGTIDKSFVEPKQLPRNLEFMGFLKGNALNEFYLKSRIIVVPSKWYEGFPNVITRGMLLKRPIITTDIGAMPSIIDNNVHGILVKPNDSKALEQAIGTLYPDVDKCRRYGTQGYLKARDSYSRETIYRTLLAAYKHLEQ